MILVDSLIESIENGGNSTQIGQCRIEVLLVRSSSQKIWIENQSWNERENEGKIKMLRTMTS